LVFIVIDGLDASGKSTQAWILYTFLVTQGKTVFLRSHPSDDSFFGVKARLFLYSRGRGAHFAAAFFYVLDVIHSILLHSWRRYDYTIFVRYLMGTAYVPSPLQKIAYYFFFVVPRPDHIFFLNVSPEEAYRRILEMRVKREMFESMDKLKKVKHKALSLASMSGWTIIDADKPIDVVGGEIKRHFVGMQPQP